MNSSPYTFKINQPLKIINKLKPIQFELKDDTTPKIESLLYSNKLLALSDFSYDKEFNDLVNNINKCDHIQDVIFNLNQLLTFARVRNDYKMFEKICRHYNDFPIFNRTVKSNNMGKIEFTEKIQNLNKLKSNEEIVFYPKENYEHVPDPEYSNIVSKSVIYTDSEIVSPTETIKVEKVDPIAFTSEYTDLPLECMLFVYTGFDIKNIIYYIEEVQTYTFVALVKAIIDHPDDNSILGDSIIKMFEMHRKYENDIYASLKYLYNNVKDSDRYYAAQSIKKCMDQVFSNEIKYIDPPKYISNFSPEWKKTGYLASLKALKYTFPSDVLELPIPTDSSISKNLPNYNQPEHKYDIYTIAELFKENKQLTDLLIENKVMVLNNVHNIESIHSSVKEFIVTSFFNSFTNNTDLNRWYGSSNPMLFGINIYDNVHFNCLQYGGCRMFLCNHDSKDENGNIKKWFSGNCDMCMNKIEKYHQAVRRPLLTGGWSGCFCSFECVRKFYISVLHYETSDTEYYNTYGYLVDYFEDSILSNGIQDR